VNFDLSSELRAFRDHLRAFLVETLPADWPDRTRYDHTTAFAASYSRDFCAKLAAAGLLVPHWPVEHGGAGLDAFHHWILGEEMVAAGEPRGYQYMNVNWVGPALLRFGSDEQKAHHLPLIRAGNVIWCQGFSEPDAGSDLAALKTRAERTATGYRINGSKLWTSAASSADYCFLLVRTGPGKREFSIFLMPMATPGVEARVIPSMMGQKALHEVFLTDVDLDRSHLLGEEGKGWSIVGAVLANERIGVPRYAMTMRGLDHAVAILRRTGRFGEAAAVRAGLARAACDASRWLAFQVINDRVKGRPPSPLINTARYALISSDRLVAEFLGDFLHEELVGNRDPLLATTYRRTGSTGIASGAAEIQLNLIARDLLDLPRGD
jgi:alkylation response protein AidB-like acyl-CoA dehydrogenase